VSWRPSPSRPNPLLALRRVVEDGGAEGTEGGGAIDGGIDGGAEQDATVRPVRAGGADGDTAARTPPATPGEPAGVRPTGRRPSGEAGGVRRWPGVPTGRRRPLALSRRPLATHAEPSHLRPDRPALALITSTPTTGGDPGDDHLLPLTMPAMTVRPGAVSGPGGVALLESPPTTGPLAAAEVVDALARALEPRPEAGVLAEGRSPRRLLGAGGRRQMSAAQVLLAALVALGLWTLVDSPALLRSAQSGPLGQRRSFAVTLLTPVRRVDAALGLDRIAQLGDRLTGHHHPTPGSSLLAVGLPPAAGRTPARTGPGTARPGGPPRSPAPASPPGTAPGPAARPGVGPTVTPLPALRTPTAADPLRVLIVGDSLGLSFGQSLAAKLDAGGVTVTTVDAREGTGLARPDAFDWPQQLGSDLVHFRPELVVASFGGNDDQDVQVNGRYITFNSPLWQTIYAARVQAVADEVHAAGAHLLWSGLPLMRSPAKSDRLSAVMDVTRLSLDRRDAALFVDNLPTLADGAGHYQIALPDASGQLVLVREPDGVHETRAGADRLADHALAVLRFAWRLDASGHAPTRS